MMSASEYARLMIQEEKERHEHPCCENCVECYTEYGWTLCYKHEEISDDGICLDWR